MWHCEDCDIEITKNKKNRHLKSGRHQKNIGNNPYHHGKIYKITCDDTCKIYIGSTILPIDDRLKKHKCDKKHYIDGKTYSHVCSSYPLLDNCRIELIEEFKCETEKELKTREQYHIENSECVNLFRAIGMSIEEQREHSKEYREKNKEKISKRRKEYVEKNKEKVAEKQKEWREKNKEKIKARKHTYYEKNKEKVSEKNKEYVEKNKEKVKSRQKEYREKNKEKIKAHKGRVVICECGVSYTHRHTSRHKRSKHHINYMEQKE